jgi:hypothetical protein
MSWCARCSVHVGQMNYHATKFTCRSAIVVRESAPSRCLIPHDIRAGALLTLERNARHQTHRMGLSDRVGATVGVFASLTA